MKTYYIQYNVGKAKYVVSYHDGKAKNKDGSPFYQIMILRSKKQLADFVLDLKGKGYTPR